LESYTSRKAPIAIDRLSGGLNGLEPDSQESNSNEGHLLTDSVRLRLVSKSNLPIFFEQQLDPGANEMAAFTAKDPTDFVAFSEHWTKVLADENIVLRTIFVDDLVAGYIVKHDWFAEPEISYWLGRDFWGRGIATRALKSFLDAAKVRPLYARAAKDNHASIRVLEICGFIQTGEDKGYSNARGEEVEEFILTLH
jgi:RimJ/RimL family protein N-acetyltransferase